MAVENVQEFDFIACKQSKKINTVYSKKKQIIFFMSKTMVLKVTSVQRRIFVFFSLALVFSLSLSGHMMFFWRMGTTKRIVGFLVDSFGLVVLDVLVIVPVYRLLWGWLALLE